ncbi:MAG: hypothetical protein JWN56_2644 [Sphingobacteriales bacterium]|nr:hypothetical protein [Sphingobacteriales bacterium]
MKEHEEENDEQSLIDKIKEYVNLRIELAKLSAVEKGSKLFATIVTDSIIGLLLVLTFVFASFGLCFYLSEVIGNTYVGFFIVAGFYLLIGLIIYAIKDSIVEKRLANRVITKVFKDRNESIYEKQDK